MHANKTAGTTLIAAWLTMLASEIGHAPWPAPPDRLGRLIGMLLAAVTAAWLSRVWLAGQHYYAAVKVGRAVERERQKVGVNN